MALRNRAVAFALVFAGLFQADGAAARSASMFRTAAASGSGVITVDGATTAVQLAVQKASGVGVVAAVEKAKSLTPSQFLLVSSPKMKKICFAQLINFKAIEGQVFPLVDSGLIAPQGICLDRARAYLYVNDFGAGKIFRYRLVVNPKEEAVKNRMETNGVRLTIVENIKSSWCSVDQFGTLFFSNADTKAVNKLPVEIIEKVASGEVLPNELKMLGEQDQEAISAAQSAARQNRQASTAGEEEEEQVYNIVSLYENGANPHVSGAGPSGLYVDGPTVYWGNAGSGKSNGAVNKGQVTPQVPVSGGTPGGTGPNAFPAEALANNTDTVSGVVKTRNSLVYADASQKVYAVSLDGAGGVYTLTDQLDSPRGLVWDGDNTVFVADAGVGRIWSLPVGRLADGAPFDSTVDLDGAYGVALLQEGDQGYGLSRAAGALGAGASAALAAALALAL